MKQDRFSTFYIQLCNSHNHNLNFAIVSTDTQTLDITHIRDCYINFQLAIIPHLPIILFSIDSINNVGAPIYNHWDGTVLYHLPFDRYSDIEENIKEPIFVISENIFEKILSYQALSKSLFEVMENIYNDIGLIAIGIYKYETAENEI